MPKPAQPLLKYNKTNLKQLSRAIISHLNPDLLPKKYRSENAVNPMFGHCHTALGCLYKIFGSQSLYMYRALGDDGIWHWWVEDRDGQITDLTASQYPKAVVFQLYQHGTRSGMLGFKYRQSVKIVLRKVCKDLGLKIPDFCKS